MKKALGFLLLISFSVSCHKDPVEPEMKATILGIVSGPYAGCQFSYALLINNQQFFTKYVLEPYAKAGTQIWIKYKLDEACIQYIPKPTNIITITSIRNQ